MQDDFITIDDIQNMGQERERERAERRAERRAEKREMEEMRQQQISMLEQQLKTHEEVKRQQQLLKDKKKEAKQKYKLMVANDPLLTLEEMLYKHTDSIHHLPKRPLEIRKQVVDEVVDELLEDVETLEALDVYDRAMGL